MTSESPNADLSVSLKAVLSDPTDGAARLMTDIAKFGFNLSELHVVPGPDGSSRLELRLAAPPNTDMENISARLARHVSVISLSLV